MAEDKEIDVYNRECNARAEHAELQLADLRRRFERWTWVVEYEDRFLTANIEASIAAQKSIAVANEDVIEHRQRYERLLARGIAEQARQADAFERIAAALEKIAEGKV